MVYQPLGIKLTIVNPGPLELTLQVVHLNKPNQKLKNTTQQQEHLVNV